MRSSASNSTPSFFVNGKRLTGEQTLAGFRGRRSSGGTADRAGGGMPTPEEAQATPEASKPEGSSGQ